MFKRHTIDKDGKKIAERFLKLKGYSIIDTKISCRQGNIDIIAKNNEYIVFVEVKTISNSMYEKSVEPVDKLKRQHMYRVARYYLQIHDWDSEFVRFDVIEVYIDKGLSKVNHLTHVM